MFFRKTTIDTLAREIHNLLMKLTNRSLSWPFVATLLFFAPFLQTLNAQTLSACNADCHSYWDPEINSQNYQKGTCYNWAGYSYYGCMSVALDDYFECLSWLGNSTWGISFCGNARQASESACGTQLQNGQQYCDSAYDQNIRDLQADLELCLNNCSSQYPYGLWVDPKYFYFRPAPLLNGPKIATNNEACAVRGAGGVL